MSANGVLGICVEVGGAEIEAPRQLELDLFVDQFVDHFLTRGYLAVARELQEASSLLDVESGDRITVDDHEDLLGVSARVRREQCDARHGGGCDAAAAGGHDVMHIKHSNVHYKSNMATAAGKSKAARTPDGLTDAGTTEGAQTHLQHQPMVGRGVTTVSIARYVIEREEETIVDIADAELGIAEFDWH